MDWFVKQVSKHYRTDVDFSRLQNETRSWIREVTVFLKGRRELYEGAREAVHTRRGADTSFFNIKVAGGYVAVKKWFDKILEVDGWARDSVQFDALPINKLQAKVEFLSPTRYFLYTVLKNIESSDPFTSAVVDEFLARYLDVIDQLCASCYLLVPRLISQIHTDKLTEEDKLAYGNHGLLIAAHRFNFERGFKFTTYARWWIRERVITAIDRNLFVVSVDCKMRSLYYKYVSDTKDLDADSHELQQALYAARPVSLFIKGEDEDDSSELAISDQDGPFPKMLLEDSVARSVWAEQAKAEFAKVLDSKELHVLVRKFEVLGGESGVKDAQISKELGLHVLKIQQLLTSAYKKLRESSSCRSVLLELHEFQIA